MSVLVAATLVIAPYKEAKAIIPAVVMLPITAMMVTAAIPAGIALVDDWMNSPSTPTVQATNPQDMVGQKALSVTIANPNDSSANESGQVRIPLSTASASSASIKAPTATASMATQTTYYNQATPQAGCQAMAAAYSGYNANACGVSAPGTQNYTFVSATTSTCVLHREVVSSAGDSCGSSDFNYSQQVNVGCLAGYTQSGTTCNLTNARAAVPDKKQDVQRSGTALSNYLGDDQGAIKGEFSTGISSNDTVRTSGYSSSGEPRVISVQATTDGGSTVKIQTQKTDGAGTTYLQTRTYVVDANNTVTSASQSATSDKLVSSTDGKSLSVSGSGTAYSPVAGSNGSATNQQQSGSGSCGGAGQPACAIDDSGFSGKDAKGGDAVQALNDGQSDWTKKIAGDGSGNGIKDGASDPNVDSSWFPNFSPTPSVCQNLTYQVQIDHGPAAGLGGSAELEICDKLEVVRSIMGWGFYIATAFYVFRTFFRSNGGGVVV
jgi:hypothetical protein